MIRKPAARAFVSAAPLIAEFALLLAAPLSASLAKPVGDPSQAQNCARELIVLGAGQDAGAPQIGRTDDEGPKLLPSSLALIDRESGQRFLFDATPAITEQLAMLDRFEALEDGLGIDGIFLTHAHIGHYMGLAYLGREAAGASNIPVFAMPRMAAFLTENGPWSQLIDQRNITLVGMADGMLAPISDTFGVWPIGVPHRDEFSETVGYIIMTPDKTALYMPDIDSWDEWEAATGDTLAELIEGFDYAFLDATFWDDNELLDESGEGRDMSAIPHPRVLATMDRLAELPADGRAKVHFIHYNHTNPIRDPDSAESAQVAARGFNVARRGDRVCLSD